MEANSTVYTEMIRQKAVVMRQVAMVPGVWFVDLTNYMPNRQQVVLGRASMEKEVV